MKRHYRHHKRKRNPTDVKIIRPVRYETKWYTTTDPIEAQRLAKIDKTDHILVTENVRPVHVTDSWAYWSDRTFTSSIGMGRDDRSIKSLSSAAVMFIDSLWGSDSPKSQKMLNNLAKIEEILSEKPIACGLFGGGPYAPPTIMNHNVMLTDGTRKEFSSLSMGYPEGYLFEVATDKQKLLSAVKAKALTYDAAEPEGD